MYKEEESSTVEKAILTVEAILVALSIAFSFYFITYVFLSIF